MSEQPGPPPLYVWFQALLVLALISILLVAAALLLDDPWRFLATIPQGGDAPSSFARIRPA